MSNPEKRGRLKLVLIGNQQVGKTSLLNRYIKNIHNPVYVHTQGGDLFEKDLIIDGRRIKVGLLDTAGQEDVRTLITSIYRDANGIMLVFDITNEESFDLLKDLYERITENTVNSPYIMVVGNKRDLMENRKIEVKRASNRADDFSANYYDVSAKSGDGVTDAFETLIKETWRGIRHSNAVEDTDVITLQNVVEPTRDSCCS